MSLETSSVERAPRAEASRAPSAASRRIARPVWSWRLSDIPTWARAVLALFLATRVGFALVTYVGDVLVLAPKYSAGSVGVSGLLGAWDQWDALWYLGIARYGYTSPQSTAFFPLYPLIVGGLAAPGGGAWVYAAGLLVSNLAFLGALFLLYLLAAGHFGEATALRAVTYLAVFPTAFFTFAPYNESLFLFLSLACFLALERRRWALAGVMAGLAALTRSAGLLLVIPFAYAWWDWLRAVSTPRRAEDVTDDTGGARKVEPGQRASGATHRRASAGLRATVASLRGAGLWAVAPLGWALVAPLAVALFAGYCELVFHDPLAFAHAQQTWNRIITWPWVTFWWQIVGLVQAAPASFFQAHDLIDLSATVLFLGLLVAGWRRLPRGQSLYMAALMLLITVEPGGVASHLRDAMTSNERFVLEMFPGFTTLALLTARRPLWRQALAIVFAMLLATFSLVFVLGRWLV